MHLLQVCNVGNICGGTAACAWSIVRALPTCRHTVVFLSRPTADTIAAFQPATVERWPQVTRERVVPHNPDVVLLHNTPATRCEPLTVVPLTIQYLHSRITPAVADVTLACSGWLRSQFSADAVDGVLYQPVHSEPAGQAIDTRGLRDRLVVGRLCTPTSRKWPRDLLPFYAELAGRHPHVDWEFVGCPESLVEPLRQACGGRVRFHPAEPTARRHLLRWDALLYHHPTLTETFGRTVAEAMLSGCIPIVDARGGFCEQIMPATGCLCLRRGDFDAALSQLADRSARRTLSAAAREAATVRFSGAAFSVRFRRLLTAALASWSDTADRCD